MKFFKEHIFSWFNIFKPLPKIKTDEQATKEDFDAIKKDWETVVGKDDGNNPWWNRK